MKAGRAGQGPQAAASHTGALAGSDVVFDAAIRRAGMLRADTLQELFLAAETLARDGVLARGRLGRRGTPAIRVARNRRLCNAGGRGARVFVARVLGEGREWLDAGEVGALLQAYRLPLPATASAAPDPEQAVGAARSLGYPVVLKIRAPDLLHKSEVGGVRLALPREAAVRAGCLNLGDHEAAFAHPRPGAVGSRTVKQRP